MVDVISTDLRVTKRRPGTSTLAFDGIKDSGSVGTGGSSVSCQVPNLKEIGSWCEWWDDHGNPLPKLAVQWSAVLVLSVDLSQY